MKELKAGTHGASRMQSQTPRVVNFLLLKDLESRRTGGLNKVEKAEGQQTWMWVPVGAFDLNCGVGYIWTRKGSNRMLFRQLLWLTENMRRA